MDRGGRENSIEREIADKLAKLAQVPVLQWQWSSHTEPPSRRSLLGARVSVVGPTLKEPVRPIRAQVTLCVRSWLEPLIRIATDGRSCIGEFLPSADKQRATSRGISIKMSANRVVPMNVHVFFFGVHRHVLPHRPQN